VIDENDVRLQRIFDERLMRVLPPPRDARRRRSARGVAALGVLVLLAASAFAFVADVDRTADAAGESCADVLAKVDVWWDSVRNGTSAQQLEFKRQAAELVGQSCASKGEVPANKPATAMTAPSAGSADPTCVAAKQQAEAWAAAQRNATHDELVALKQRITTLLTQSCTLPAKPPEKR
jgi:hypothetical protein